MSHHSVAIGHEFFGKIKSDYSNWKFALAREFFQNCADAPGSSLVTIEITEISESKSRLSVFNNGAPMSRDILMGKLLCLGGSTKDMVSTVGGFGVAKSLLYLCHESYEIATGDLVVRGSGGSYELLEGQVVVQGTRSTVVVEASADSLLREFRSLLSLAQWSGRVVLNGVVHSTSLRKGSPRRDLGFGQVYTNNSFPNKLVVRMNGLPMFQRYVRVDKCVLIELAGRSCDVLTSNRDGLQNDPQAALSAFVDELAVDKQSALKRRSPEYRHFEGYKLGFGGKKPQVATGAGESGVVCKIASNYLTAAERALGSWGRDDASTGAGPVALREAVRTLEFVVKNNTDLVVPDYYLPGSWGKYASQLASVWGALLVRLHVVLNRPGAFAVGFVFDADAPVTEASVESGKFGQVYFLNPAEVVSQSESASRSFRKRFKLTERNRLLMLAVHEFVHGSYGLSWHDEEYANKLTDVMVKVLDHRKEFNTCFTPDT